MILARGHLVLLASVVSSLLARAQSEDTSINPNVWFWSSHCDGPDMSIEVQLDAKIMFRSTVPLCFAPFGEKPDEELETRLTYEFAPTRSIRWTGYTEEPQTSAPDSLMIGDIWLAGSEEDLMIVGITFRNDDRIFMNTLHFAEPYEEVKSEVAPGFVVVTAPCTEGKNPSC